MLANPPDSSLAGTVRVLDDVIRVFSADAPHLCGSIPCPGMPGDPMELVYFPPRMSILLEGRDIHATSVRGRRVDVELQPGQGIFFAANSWSIPFFSAVGELFSIVFLPEFVRYVQVRLSGAGSISDRSPFAYQTAAPLIENTMHVARALNGLAEEGNSGPAARELFLALLHLARQHLADDVPAHHEQTRAIYTWHNVRNYLREHFGRDVSRESVAQAMGLHPNYLSSLARHAGGQTFRQALDGIRLQHARRLLMDTDLKLARIATLCGYGDAACLARTFRRTTGITPGQFRGKAERS